MLSSTSSSNQRLPSLEWRTIWWMPVLLPLCFILILEGRLALRGFQPTLVDSETHWQEERARVAGLGKNALVLVGASRIQLGVDIPLLRTLSGKEPVQLAIDGNSYAPVLQSLAEDPGFIGTVIVDFAEGANIVPMPTGLATAYTGHYRQQASHYQNWNFDRIENRLSRLVQGILRSYADGARPLDSLLSRLMEPPTTRQYLLTHPDRSRSADYSRVPMPDFYLSRVMRHLGKDAPDAGTTFASQRALHEELARRIARLPADDPAKLAGSYALLTDWLQKIRGRGGRVIMLAMPTSGLVHDADRKRYPRELFWDPLAKTLPATMIHYEDFPAMRQFICPDGSHLDYRSKPAFTMALVNAAGLQRTGR